jgi:RNA polymerase sigma-70 factor, ECF subfamily
LLVDRYGPTTYRLCRTILRSSTEAEDAAQDALIRAWRELPNLRDTKAWPAWLRAITVRTSIDMARRRRPSPLGEVRPAWGPDPSVEIASRDAIDRALAELRPEDRAILALRYYVDLEVPDVAVALGLPLGTAKSRLNRAIGRLRASLGDANEP